jgi:hypothetical protein
MSSSRTALPSSSSSSSLPPSSSTSAPPPSLRTSPSVAWLHRGAHLHPFLLPGNDSTSRHDCITSTENTFVPLFSPPSPKCIGVWVACWRDFQMTHYLWNNDSECDKYDLASWKHVVMKKEYGGLVIPNLRELNLCLFVSWIRRHSLD